MRFRCIQAKLVKPFELNVCWKNMGVEFTVQLSGTPRKPVKNIDWIGLGHLGTDLIICTRNDKTFFNLMKNFSPKLFTQSEVVSDEISASSSYLVCRYTCCCVYLHSSPILDLYVVILRATQSAVFICKASPRSHFIYCICWEWSFAGIRWSEEWQRCKR
jgi:hypothetical protein